MKRLTFLLVPILLLTALVLAVSAKIPTEGGPPSAVQQRLEQYSWSSFVGEEAHIRLVTRAQRPWNVTRDLGWPVLGSSVHFQTDHPLTLSRGDALAPLPFPPKVVWCALLETENGTTGGLSHSVLLVGLHMDMYNSDWIIHQAPSAPLSTLHETLSSLGCNLGLD
jgi:hypothetical protein